MAYLGMLYMEHTHNNPILRTFCHLVVNKPKRKSCVDTLDLPMIKFTRSMPDESEKKHKPDDAMQNVDEINCENSSENYSNGSALGYEVKINSMKQCSTSTNSKSNESDNMWTETKQQMKGSNGKLRTSKN